MEPALVSMQETWAAMEVLTTDGLAKNIGLCNVTTSGLRDVLSYATVPPAVLQVERHVYLQQPRLVRMCREAGVAITGFSPLGSSSYVELAMATPEDSALSDPVVQRIAEKHRRTTAQVLLRWGLDGGGTSVVPKSVKIHRLEENLRLGLGFEEGSTFKLDAADIEDLRTLDKGRRFNDPGEFCTGMGCFCPIYD